MDYDMPIMNGVEAAKQLTLLQNQELIRKIPIIAVSAYSADEDIDACFDAGMSDYGIYIYILYIYIVTKPFARETLLKVLVRWLGQQHTF